MNGKDYKIPQSPLTGLCVLALVATCFSHVAAQTADPAPSVCYDLAKAPDYIRQAQPVEPFEILDGLFYVGNTQVSAHLLKTADGLILMDSVMPHQVPWLLESIRKLGLQPRDVKVVIGTHTAVDHTGNHWYLQRYFGAQVWLHELDAPAALAAGCAGGSNLDLTHGPNPTDYPPFIPDRLIKDGETIEWGGRRIAFFHTPVSNPGAITIEIPLQDGSGKILRAAMVGGAAPRMSGFAESLQRLKTHDIEVWLAVHPEQNQTLEKAARLKAGAAPNPFIDPQGWNGFLNRLISLDKAPSALAITTTSLPNGTTGAAYSQTVAATGGRPPYTWNITAGSPPTGIIFSATGIISGTPTTAGTASFTTTVTDAVGATASRNFRIIFSSGTVVTDPANPGRLINLSILTTLSAGETMAMGTVIGGSGTSGTKPLLARAAGPSLTQFGVSNVLSDPRMSLVDSAGSAVMATNNDWGSSASALSVAFAQVGAFAYLSTASRDAAIFSPQLPVGIYTVQISDNATGAGTVISELYDATPLGSFTAATPRVINISVLKHIGSGLTAGFVVGGTGSKTLLIRVIGPSLEAVPFNVAGVVSDPQLTLFSGETSIGANDNWGGTAALSAVFSQVGAFALPSASRDAAFLATLPSGNYTVLANGVGGQTGVALIEVYEVP